MTTVLAIDQGTSGTKAVVVDGGGNILGLTEITVTPTYSSGGSVEQDPQEILDSVIAAGRSAVEQSRALVDIVTIANQGETVLAWDPRTGDPLSNMVVWQDRRAETITGRLEEHSKQIEAKTGLVLDPYFSAPKQAWIRENVTREGVVTTSDSWLVHRLTGEFVTDVSTASRSLVTNLETGEWDAELLDLFGLGDESLPKILNSDEIAGVTTEFGGLMPVGGLIVDQQAALLAEKCLAVGEAKCTFGTGAFLLANTGPNPVRSSAKLAASIAWRTRKETAYCFDGQVYTAASAVRWLQKMGFIANAAGLDPVAAETNDGVFSVPAFAGLAAPRWRPTAKASFTGVTLSTGPEHMVLAVLQGIAAQVAELLELVQHDMGQAMSSLRVDGGLTQSRVLMQSVADLTQIPIEVYPSQHATPLGAAALARVAAQSGGWIRDSIVPWEPATVFEPNWRPDQAAEFRSRWAAVADSAH